MACLHTLSFPRFAYADCLREDYREASAKCLRVPTRTCKYQCFGFRGVNMSSPHKKVPSFQKKTWLIWQPGVSTSSELAATLASKTNIFQIKWHLKRTTICIESLLPANCSKVLRALRSFNGKPRSNCYQVNHI